LAFAVHLRNRKYPLIESATVLDGAFNPVDPKINEAFTNGGLIENDHPELELSFSLRVFNISDLPREFILRCPDVEFGDIWFRVPDFAFRYFSDRNAVGLCRSGVHE
jgi:hypothetical protein